MKRSKNELESAATLEIIMLIPRWRVFSLKAQGKSWGWVNFNCKS